MVSNNKYFKCFVQLNHFNHRIIIKDNSDNIAFGVILNKVQTQTKQNLSLKTHSFEIFDTDFEEYVLITSDKQIVDNLSRIRVWPKTNNNYEKISSTSSIEESLISTIPSRSTLNSISGAALIDLSSNPISIIDKDHNFHGLDHTINPSSELEQNDKKVAIKGKVDKNSSSKSVIELLKSELVVNSIEGAATKPKSLVNYFGPQIYNCGRNTNSSELQFEITVENFESLSLIALKLSYNEISAYKSLLRIMTQNIDLFKANQSKVAMNDSWIITSIEMMRNGFSEWSPQKCMDSFIGSVSLYRKVLVNASSYEIASKVYPLFEIIHSFDLNYFKRPKSVNNIKELREMFELENCKQKKVINAYGLNSYSVDTNSQSNTIINFFGRKIHKLVQSHSCGLVYESTVERLGNDSYIVLKFSSVQINAYKLLLGIMTQKICVFEINSSKEDSNNAWIEVSDQMIRSGYREWSAEKCRNSFMGSINWYKKVLTKAPNSEVATKAYPLFKLIHSFDFKYFINKKKFNTIMKLRQNFGYIIDNQRENVYFQLNSIEKELIEANINANQIQNNTSDCVSTSKNINELKSKQLKESHIMKIASKLNKTNIKALKSMVEIMDSIICSLGRNVSFWNLVSYQMVENGYSDFTAIRCENNFTINIGYYKLALINSSDYKAASSAYPLFEFFYKLDLKPLLKSKTFAKIDKCRKEFDKRVCTTQGKTIEAKLDDELNANNLTGLNDSYSKQQLLDLNKCQKDVIKANFKLKNKTKIHFPRRMSKMSDTDVKAFHSMVAVIYSIAAQVGIYAKNFWELMSSHMKAIGYHEYDAEKCEKKFKNDVCNYYKQVLIHCPDYKSACSVYPLFDFIYKLNLKPLLSSKVFRKINEKRQKFDRAIGKEIETKPSGILDASQYS